MMQRKVLIPLDRTVYSRKILVPIRQFISPSETELILFHVADPPKGVGLASSQPDADITAPDQVKIDFKETMPHPIYADQMETSISSQMTLKLQPEVDMLQQVGFSVSTIVAFGDPVDEVLRVIKEKQINLIAMTTHAREGLKRLLFGSVAEQLLHQVNIPILLLHPEERPKAEAAELVRGKTPPKTGSMPA